MAKSKLYQQLEDLVEVVENKEVKLLVKILLRNLDEDADTIGFNKSA